MCYNNINNSIKNYIMGAEVVKKEVWTLDMAVNDADINLPHQTDAAGEAISEEQKNANAGVMFLLWISMWPTQPAKLLDALSVARLDIAANDDHESKIAA